MAEKELTIEELKKLLKEAEGANADLGTQVSDLTTKLEQANEANSAMTEELDTLRKGLSITRTKDLDPRVREMIQEKMSAGLSEQQAIECTFRQIAHNETISGKAKTPPKPAQAKLGTQATNRQGR